MDNITSRSIGIWWLSDGIQKVTQYLEFAVSYLYSSQNDEAGKILKPVANDHC